MGLDEKIAVTGTSDPRQDASEPFSAAWWQNRTAEELRDIIKRGFAGGEAFKGAVAEAERRGREATKRLREAAAIEAVRHKQRMRLVGFGALAVLVLLVSVGWYFPV